MEKNPAQNDGTHGRSWTAAIAEHNFGPEVTAREREAIPLGDGGDPDPSSSFTPTQLGASATHHELDTRGPADQTSRQVQLQSWLANLYPSAQVFTGNRVSSVQNANMVPIEQIRNHAHDDDFLHVRNYSPFSTYLRLPAVHSQFGDQMISQVTTDAMPPPRLDDRPTHIQTQDESGRQHPVHGAALGGQEGAEVAHDADIGVGDKSLGLMQVVGQDGRLYYLIPASQLHSSQQTTPAPPVRLDTTNTNPALHILDAHDVSHGSLSSQVVGMQPNWQSIQVGFGDGGNSSVHTDNKQTMTNSKRKAPRKRTISETSEVCSCKKSQCLKMYCVCFAQGVFCQNGCQCDGCLNVVDHLNIVNQAKMDIKRKNPHAFESKLVKVLVGAGTRPFQEQEGNDAAMQHKIGCKCSRTKCIKKYCECFRVSVPCSLRCICVDCKNPFGQAGVTHDGQAVRMIPVAAAKPHDRTHSSGLDFILQTSGAPTLPEEGSVSKEQTKGIEVDTLYHPVS